MDPFCSSTAGALAGGRRQALHAEGGFAAEASLPVCAAVVEEAEALPRLHALQPQLHAVAQVILGDLEPARLAFALLALPPPGPVRVRSLQRVRLLLELV